MADFGKYKMSFAEARSVVDALDDMSDVEFRDQLRHWAIYDVPDSEYNVFYKPVRTALVQSFDNALRENSYHVNYNLDLTVGIKLYELLSPSNDFTIIQANDDDIWRYLSVRVMPDITFIRYPNIPDDVQILQESLPGLSYAIAVRTEKDSIRIKKKRFYSHTRRIWLKTLWWYIHLGWQGDSETTYKVLKNNGTNIISHFIERPGRGYRPELFRCMLYAYSLLPEQKDSTFRAAAKMNLAKCVTVEPALTEGGEKEYARRLFDEVTATRVKDDDNE